MVPGGVRVSESVPIRADYRIMREILASSFAKAGVSPTPGDLDVVASVFKKAGGTWERVFRGSVRDVNLLKKTIKVAIDSGRLTKSSQWDG